MRIFVYEFLSAGDGSAAASLLTEGWAMLAALLEDFARVPDAEVHTLLGPATAGRALSAGVVVHPADGNEEAVFRRLAADADATLVVAPEIRGVLPDCLQRVEEVHGRSLGPTPAAARLAGDKLRLAEHMHACGVPTPPTALWPTAALSYPAVCKPRHGAGSQATFLVGDEEELRRAVEAARVETHDDLIVQPYVPGRAASVAFLIGPGRRLALPAATQRLSADGRFGYQGGTLPLPPDLAERATRIAARAVDAVDGLRGHVGVDVVLGAAADGGGDCVVEINPRFTTSYVGLRALARFNLAEALLAVVSGQAPPAWDWRAAPLSFTPDGRVRSFGPWRSRRGNGTLA